MNTLKDKKIILYPQVMQIERFVGLMNYLRETYNCKIYPITVHSRNSIYHSLVDDKSQIITLPEFYFPQTWEANQDELDKIDEKISACEAALDIPVNQILLAGERDIGRAYSYQHYYWCERTIAKKVIKDNGLPTKVLRRYFYFAFNMIETIQPDIILGGPKGAVLGSVMHFVSEYMKVPFLSCYRTYIHHLRHFWTGERCLFNTSVSEIYEQKIALSVPASKYANEAINKFRKEPETPKVIKNFWKNMQKNKLKKASGSIKNVILENIIRFIKKDFIYEPRRISSNISFFYMTLLRSHFFRKYYSRCAEDDLKEMKYIYFPLHQMPEFVLNVQSPFWYNQINTVFLLTLSLPYGYKLLVKTHRSNDGRRSSRLLKSLLALPNVILIDAYDSQYKYLRYASLIVTENGTTGLEGLYFKKPVLTLDKTHYDPAKLTCKLDSVSNLSKIIYRLIHHYQPNPNHDDRLALLHDAEYEASISDADEYDSDVNRIIEILNKGPKRQDCGLNFEQDTESILKNV